MYGSSVLDSPTAGLTASYLARVVSVKDPDGLSRVQVRLLNFDGPSDQDAPLWARVAVPFAGSSRGAFFLPDVDDEVLVTFINGDDRQPVVVGSLWNGNAKAPEQLGGSGDRVDRWTVKGKAGSRIAIVEESSGQPTISFETPGGVKGTLTDSGGGKIEFVAAGTTITLNSSGVSVQTQSKVQVQATDVKVTSGTVTVNAATATFSGMVKCDMLQTTTVIATTYMTGAGNIW